MFFHADNQRILYETLQKSPFFMEYSQKFAGKKEQWFRSTSEQFYESEREEDVNAAINPKSLLEINKQALRFMIADLKRLLGYHDILAPSVPISVYNVSLEKASREDKWSNEYKSYQEEYNRLLAPPVRPETAFASEMDEKIKNMDELLAEQVKRRTIDYAELMPPAPSNGPSTNTGSIRLKIMEDIDRLEMTNSHPLQSVSPKVRFSEQIEQYA
jgi:hypothetical protein